MVDTHRMAELMRLADQHGCSLRLVGDPAQLSAIGPGGLLPRIVSLDAVPTAELVEIYRTRHQWLQDFQNRVRGGDAATALSILREHDAAHMLATHADAMQRMVDDWNVWRGAYAPGDSLLVVHTTNADVDTVNLLAQAKRRDAGELGEASVRAPDRAYELHDADRVMFREGAYRFDDREMRRVENGTRGTIESIDAQHMHVTVRLEEPGHEARSVEVDLERCAALRLDYASHVYPAQGDTRSRTAELTGGPSVSRESAYVGGSRLRDRHDLYTSREALGTDGTDLERWQRLADQINESRAELPSIAYTEQPDRQIAANIPEPVRDVSTRQLADVQHELERAIRDRDELARRFPTYIDHEIRETQERADRQAAYARELTPRIQQAQARESQLKPWQRAERKQLREQTYRDIMHRAELSTESRALTDRAHQMRIGPNGPDAWKREHGAELTQRGQRVNELTRERDHLRDRAIDRSLQEPSRYLTRMLGERPVEAERRETWDQGARAVETYRLTYNVTDRHTALGREPEGDFNRHLAFDGTKKDISRARDTLGLANRAHSLAPDRIPGISIDRPGHGFSRER